MSDDIAKADLILIRDQIVSDLKAGIYVNSQDVANTSFSYNSPDELFRALATVQRMIDARSSEGGSGSMVKVHFGSL